MYCPRCGAENMSNQQYCRKCGLALPAVALALEGRFQDAIASLDRAQKPLIIGFALLALFFVIVALTIATDGRVGFANPLSAVGSLTISLPFLIMGAARARQAHRLFHGIEASRSLPESQVAAHAIPMTSPMMEFGESDTNPATSVTDATTKELKEPRNT